MSRQTGIEKLSDRAIQAALKAQGKDPGKKKKKIIDGGGLFLLPKSGEHGWWRFRFYWEKKEQLISLGVYPEIGLREARDLAAEARKNLRQGIRPTGTTRKHLVQAQEDGQKISTLREIADSWFDLWKIKKNQKNIETTRGRLDLHVLSRFGNLSLQDAGKKINEIAETIKAKGQDKKGQTLDKILTILKLVGKHADITDEPGAFDFLRQIGKIQYHFPRPESKKHHPALVKPEEIGELHRKILDAKTTGKISAITAICLMFAARTFARPGQITIARWDQIDFNDKIWYQPEPAENEKGRVKVPLADQVIKLLTELRAISGHTDYLFPAQKSKTKNPWISENSMGIALIRMGYKNRQTAHGFRSTAKTILTRAGFPWLLSEEQLGHGVKNQAAAAYWYGYSEDQSRKMLQYWSDAIQAMIEKNPLPDSSHYR